MYYDKQTERYHSDKSTLPKSRGQTQGLRVANDAMLAGLGIIKAVRDALPFDAVAAGGYKTILKDGVAHMVCNTMLKAEALAISDATLQAEHVAEAPSGDLAAWSKREKCLLLVCYKLARQHWPKMTKASFLASIDEEWDATIDAEQTGEAICQKQ